MKQGWLIYSGSDAQTNQTYIDWFIKEAELQDLNLELILREDISIGIVANERSIKINGKSVSKPAFVVVRIMDPFLSLYLESCGIAVFNPSSISRVCNDKALTHHCISKLNIPMVDTLFFRKNNNPASPPLPYPFVAKETMGRGGSQVYYIEDHKGWENAVSVITDDFIVQSSNVKLGKDLRVFVVGREIVGAVLRESDHDFRANFKLGGSAKLYTLSEQEKSMIQKIVNHFNFGMVGIDFLIGTDDGLLFNEIEDVVGSRTLSAVSNINIVWKYVTYIKTTIEKRNSD
ncbi:hypothetical protein CIL03_01375 [Virgibacillus indicus]|uniref:ATP-grasp domain-containing protein n=1 Tax=Virgibacillus indicus TaxID=2024554 RepID=A0A265NF33_9BACI|nr:ATP-grasp domain-containing protein [Virgibacillus indicus]OZU90660.1 hypothetical protein CIL03_01375 [Virgibacillus indicus]